jgi:hypothetical protein
MKNIVILFLIFLFAGQANGQVPQNINYQAVARNNNGQALANQTIKIRLSIMDGGTSLYSETRSVTTNALGLFNVRIGTPGTISTTGSFTTIDWANNQPEIKLIKVELDISNTNVFTDMGSQPLASVPYALVAENTRKIGGFDVGTGEPNNEDVLQWDGSEWEPGVLRIGTKPVSSTVPNTGDQLQYNGTNWVPIAGPAIYGIAGTIPSIPFGGGAAPWTMAGPVLDGFATVTVTAGQKITANFVGVFGHGNNNSQPCSFAVCYQQVIGDVPTGVITAFFGAEYPDGTVAATPNKTTLAATGFAVLPAGTYRIFLGLKNKSTTTNFGANDYVNGTVIVF